MIDSSYSREGCWARCLRFFRGNKRQDSLEVSLLDAHEVQPPSNPKKGFSLSTIIASSLNSISIITISSLLSKVLNRVATDCFEAEVESQEAFNECESPYREKLLFYHIALAVNSFVFGYMIQKAVRAPSPCPLERARHKFLLFQKTFSWEWLLFVTYLYNGIGINVSDSASFRGFLNCIAAGTSLFAFSFGIYTKKALDRSQEGSFPLPLFLSQNQKTLLSSMGITSISFILASCINPKTKTSIIVADLSLLLFSRSVGKVFALWIDGKKGHELAPKVLNFQEPLIIVGYSIYSLLSTTEGRIFGMLFVGVSQGIHAERNSAVLIQQKPKEERSGLAHLLRYLPTASLISFLIALNVLDFLDCEGAPSKYNYSCPIGLELSGYTTPNQVVIQSKGASLIFIAGLSQYYLRKFCRHFSDRHWSFLKYLEMHDRYNFDIASLSFYALLQSNSEKRGFYTYDPFISLFLFGIAFGNYKDRVNMGNQISYEKISGAGLANYEEVLARLRIEIFKEYPYLYEGDLPTERGYLSSMYFAKESSLCFLAKEEEKVIGMALGGALSDIAENYIEVFNNAGFDTDAIFYLGDLILLKEYRGKKLGGKFYELFEEEVRKNKKYKKMVLCQLFRDPNDPRKEEGYRSLEGFWRRYGFTKHPELSVSASWIDIGEAEPKEHELIFFIKDLLTDS